MFQRSVRRVLGATSMLRCCSAPAFAGEDFHDAKYGEARSSEIAADNLGLDPATGLNRSRGRPFV
jgi:hypothetical protein